MGIKFERNGWRRLWNLNFGVEVQKYEIAGSTLKIIDSLCLACKPCSQVGFMYEARASTLPRIETVYRQANKVN